MNHLPAKNKRYTFILFSALASLLFLFAVRKPVPVAAPAPLYPVPSQKQLDWHEMEMNAFIHFTTNTYTGLEWGNGDESERLFNPSQMDAMQWATVLKNAGFKGIILTAKHHDGFCLWPSKYTEHSVKGSPWKGGKGDVVRDLSDACKKAGLRFGVYLSPWDRNRADYGQASYIDYYRNQLRELFTGYGPVFEMWFDGANGGNGYYGGARETRRINGATYYDWTTTLNLVRAVQPGVLFFSDAGPDLRWCGNESGVAGETNWNLINNDTLYAGKSGIERLLNTGSPDGTRWIPAEVDVSIRKGWFYHSQEDSLVKSPERLFDIYLTTVGRGSTLLLNVPPDRRGLLHENDVVALAGFRKLLDREFKTNLAAKATTTASSVRGNDPVYNASRLVDGNKETYWATGDGVTTGSIEINLGRKQPVKYVLLQEYIRLGQRVQSFTIDAWQQEGWKQVATGTTIGYKRILKITPLETNRIRVNFQGAKACLVISNAEVY